MPKNGNNANIFNLEFGHENFTLTVPPSLLKEVPPFVLSPSLLRFFSSPPFVSEPKYSSPPENYAYAIVAKQDSVQGMHS